MITCFCVNLLIHPLMRTVYSNTVHPRFVKWSSIVAFVVGIILFFLYLLQITRNEGVRLSLYIMSSLLMYGAAFYGQYKLLTLTIDDEADTITDSRQKKYPLKISRIKTATYKVSKKGRFRSLFLHDTHAGFMDIRTSRDTAEKIVAHIRELNPAVEVKTENFL